MDPDHLDEVSGTVRITADISISSGTIDNVKYKIADRGGCDYSSSWITMSKSGDNYIADWNSGTVDDGMYYITVRAESNLDIYGYNWIEISVDNGT